MSDLTQYLHAACFSPTPSMLIKAINNGHFTTWPGFTTEAVKKHLPKSDAMVKGHLDQKRKNIQSTQAPLISAREDNDCMELDQPEIKCNVIYAAMITSHEITGKIYTDLTGRFPQQSSQGNK